MVYPLSGSWISSNLIKEALTCTVSYLQMDVRSAVAQFVERIVLQQTHHIVTHTGPHKVTSSNIYQIKAQSLGSSKLHDATVRTEGEFFYGPSTEGTPNALVKSPY